jgi:peptide/nickel transport system permease protein
VVVSPVFYRLARDGARTVSRELFIDAARVAGLGRVRIVFRHVAPNVATPVIVQIGVVMGMALLTESGLNFLGLGTPPPNPSWGGMISDASSAINQQPWMMVPPGAAIVLTVLAFGALSDHFRSLIPGASSLGSPWRRGTGRSVPVKGVPDPSAGRGEDAALLTVSGLRAESEAAGRPLLDIPGSLRVNAGQVVALVGESGSGKTMTAMAIMGLLPAGVNLVAGSVRYRGEELVGLDDRALSRIRGAQIGYIGQEPMSALDPVRSVAQHVDEILRVHTKLTRTQRPRRIRALLSDVGIPEPARVERAYPHELSGGLAQRVCIAMALAAEPELLIADEPTTALDVTVQAEILQLLTQLCAEHDMAMIIVTHDFGVVADVADETVVLRDGKVVEAAPVIELFQQPRHPYTKALLAANPYGSVPKSRLATAADLLEVN